MRKKIVAGNWKMNKNVREAHELFDAINKINSNDVEIVVAPPFLYLESFSSSESNIKISAQNCAATLNGAFTGEVSAEMLASLKVSYSLVGHSERRTLFNETDQQIQNKVNQLLNFSICPIFCCGESLAEREAGIEKNIILSQLSKALFHLSSNQIQQVVIAYEPVWAIGTGKTATAAQAQEMHAYIREQLGVHYTNEIAQKISILYGGSCNASNAAELFANIDVDGGLIGGASLQAESFDAIIKALEKS